MPRGAAAVPRGRLPCRLLAALPVALPVALPAAAGGFPLSCFLSLATERPWPPSARAPGDIRTGSAGDEECKRQGSRSWKSYRQLWEPDLKNNPSDDSWAGGVSETAALPPSVKTHPCHGPLWDQRLAEGSG